MSIRIITGAIILISMAIPFIGCKDKQKAEAPVAVVEERIKSPADSSVIDEIWYFFNGDIQKNMQLAHTTFASKDYDEMVRGIDKAAAIMKLESIRASGQDKTDLNRSIKQMHQLADDVRNNTFVPDPQYEQAFGNAQYVLGKFHLNKAKEMWNNKDYFNTGRELYEATLNLENAYLWMDHKIDSLSSAALGQSNKVASELMNDAGWTSDDVNNVFRSMDQEIGALRDKVAA
jgi:hypothetical protein